MAHLSENVSPLRLENIKGKISGLTPVEKGVELVVLPYYRHLLEIQNKNDLYNDLTKFLDRVPNGSIICILTSPCVAADFSSNYKGTAHLKLWVAVKLANPIKIEGQLDAMHGALLIFSKYNNGLIHTKTRIQYSYCPACDKTTKDYGGKKHLYHEYGTLMSDIWRDITVDFNKIPTQVIDRLRDLFGLEGFDCLNLYDERQTYQRLDKKPVYKKHKKIQKNDISSQLVMGDSIEELKKIPDNSLDFCFADPPYNIKKKYENWDDGIDIKEYFEWCDQWLSELARILKPNRTLAVLNIPQWCIRHFKHLNTILDYQDWIAWEGLSLPVRMIMPAHYSILCFSKGKPRSLPGLIRKNQSELEKKSIMALAEGFCVRAACINSRNKVEIKDKEISNNLWSDVHRLKHNSRRLDHPCQLPPLFMYRLISLFTNEGESVLDPFNGIGTTTLTAAQLNRKYIGIELSDYYHNITVIRHNEILQGLDPFRKNNDNGPKAKNSRVARLQKQKYEVSKKVLQLEVRKITNILGHVPTKEELSTLSTYPLEYYETYFINWGEVCAAARTTGMSETRKLQNENKIEQGQLTKN